MSHNTRFHYTDKETQYIKDNYLTYTAKAIADHLGRSPSAIVCKAFSLGVSTYDRTPFTKEDEQYIRDNFKTMPYRDIALHLGRHPIAINKKVNRMGLSKHKRRNVK